MPNRLAGETSPYLRLHADDPVDWYPWGAEAFARARDLGRPIFLSVGYASCHWCHVMHRESFRDPATAEALNERFVSIKVDRESRPDVDEVYMAYVVAANGHGGWPMSVFLTPSLLPVFGGTYFPPESAQDMPSFLDILDQVSGAFGDRPHVADATAEEAVEYLRAMFAPPLPEEVDPGVLHCSADALLATVDWMHGGFGGAPKFPQAPVTDFLLAYYAFTGDDPWLVAAEKQMRGIVRGGIFDQVGGGIARYAVDDEWLVPHFEKMLYDNAQLLTTLASLHTAKPNDEWARAIRATADFLDRDLATGDGAYASSLSADTLGEEGATYVWTYDELADILSPAQLAIAEDFLGVTLEGNWEGCTILTRRDGRATDAEAVDAVLATLLAERQQRPQPEVDTKVLVSWNALAARGLLGAGVALADPELAERGVALTRHLLDRAVAPDGGVVHLLGDKASADVRLVEDATALALAAALAHNTTGDSGLLASAIKLLDHAQQLFAENGVWYMTPADTELPLRPREQHDSPTPTGASMAALAALSIWRTTGEARFRDLAEDTLARMAPIAERSPLAAGTALAAMCELLGES
ncbi:MAG TPA: thioredoxin domain-containing protein [Coriobacteriia bacterium]